MVLSHLNQTIGLNKHKLSLLGNDNAAECSVCQKNETIHDGAIVIKETT